MSQQNTPTKRERRDAARAQRLEHEQAAAGVAARRKRLTQLGALLAAAVVIVIVAIAVSSGGSSKKSSGAGAGGALQGVAATKSLIGGIPQQGITLGNANAPVTIVEFADPQCPFCKEYTLNEMPAVVQKYVRTGKAKMELRLLTFIGPDSVTAAGVLSAAGQQNKLWNSADLLYRNQGEENSGYVTDAFLTKVLTGAGADAAKAIAGAGSSAVSQEIAAAKTLSDRYGVTGTPTILVGPTGGQLKTDGEGQPTAAGVGKLVDAALAAKGGR
ncbi:DsbA family protein [Baekduia sp.]|jgi:protein-disulfide isomerase|uniref:DsbA family protein n=1 Tax=Baekduia sp. TaxID=2600305 RepID=UPI002E0D09D0|nr:DsbA family protein [Baekduia sp.]